MSNHDPYSDQQLWFHGARIQRICAFGLRFVVPIFLILSGSMFAQEKKPFALLSGSAVHDISRLCSREGVSGLRGSWHPNADQIGLLESRLISVSRLRSNGEQRNVQILQPDAYYRQYIPVVVGAQKLIYVNAFSFNPPASWRTRLVDSCDTGATEWGVFYDPTTGEFSDLRTNSALLVPPPPTSPRSRSVHGSFECDGDVPPTMRKT